MGCQNSIQVANAHQIKYKFASELFASAPPNPQNQHHTPPLKNQLQNTLEYTICHYQDFIQHNPHIEHHFDGLGCIEDQVGYFEGRVQQWYKTYRQKGIIQGNPYDALSVCLSLKQDVTEAQSWYLQMIKKLPTLQHLYFGLGNLYYKLKNFEKAEQFYRKTIQLNPRVQRAYQNIAFIYCYHLYDNNQADQWAKFTLKINPRNEYASLIRQLVKDNIEHRVPSLLKLQSNYPNYARIHNALGSAYLQMSQIDESIKWFKSGIDINPNYYALYCGLAIAYNVKGELDSSIKMSQQSIEMNPGHHDSYLNMGDAHNKKGNAEEAEKWYKKCLSVNKDFQVAYYELGKLYRKQGNDIEAEFFLEMSIKIDPDFTKALLELGKMKLLKKQKIQGFRLLKKVLELQEGNTQCLLFLAKYFVDEYQDECYIEKGQIYKRRIMKRLDILAASIQTQKIIIQSSSGLYDV